jgi:hypothetical protein
MKNNIIFILLLQLVLAAPTYSQLFNDGAEITIQENAFIHIQGDFTNQGGVIFNDGLIEIAGNWFNTVAANPLNPGSGTVELVGGNQNIGGDFNTLFNVLELRDDQTITLDRTIGIQELIDIANGRINLNTNTLHILNPSSDAITFTDGGIIAETSDVYSYVRWDIGETGSGSYAIPFVNNTDTSIAVSYSLETAGTGTDGYILATTYGTDADNNPLPLGITNLDLASFNSGLNVVDRFWNISAVDYTTTPDIAAGFGYDPNAESSTPNSIDPLDLQVISWNTASAEWDTTPDTQVNGDSASTLLMDNYGDFALWSEEVSSVIDQEKLIELSLFPNPSRADVNLSFEGVKTENGQILLMDYTGKIVKEVSSTFTSGSNTLNIDVADLADGMYHLIIVSDELNGIKKFVKI